MVDRNLLLAFIAFREKLIEEWALHSVLRFYRDDIEDEDTLAKKLRRLMPLSEEERAHLERAVDEELGHHHGDVEACLRALAPSESILSLVAELTGEETCFPASPVQARQPESFANTDTATPPPLTPSDSPSAQTTLVKVAQVCTASDEETIVPASLPPTSSPPDSLAEKGGAGRYVIQKSIAQGGLGEIFQAMDSELDRVVVVKKIKGKLADDDGLKRQFEREAKITGELAHPGIVPVYGLGLDEQGRPFYAMRLIEGESLKTHAILFHNPEKLAEVLARKKEDEGPAPSSKGKGLSADRMDRALLEGEPILRLRAMLARFITVCNAVQFAHARGYIHRDLKPENIMLGKYGETLVVDWGLATEVPPPSAEPPTEFPEGRPDPELPAKKTWVRRLWDGRRTLFLREHATIIDSRRFAAPTAEDPTEPEEAGEGDREPPELAETRLGGNTGTGAVRWGRDRTLKVIKPGQPSLDAGAIIGTPHFMSPEQARGDNHLVSEPSDIYSLGATLFFLLTGRAPFASGEKLQKLLERVIHGFFPQPREINPQVPKPLEAICLKAMALKPASRYASAEAISHDVERWLADEPVSAYEEPWPVKIARHVRKNRATYFSGAAAILVALVISGASTWMIRGQRLSAKAQEQVRLLKETNDPDSVVRLISEIDASGTRALVDPELRRILQEPSGPDLVRLNAGWTLAAADSSPRLTDFLIDQVLDEKTPVAYIQPLRKSLLQRPGLVGDDRLWPALRDPSMKDGPWLRGAAILAERDPAHANWEEPIAPSGDAGETPLSRVADLLVHQDPGSVGAWSRLFEKIGPRLARSLQSAFLAAKGDPDTRSFAISLLLDYSKDQPSNLAPILAAATKEEFARLIGGIRALRLAPAKHAELVAELRQILKRGSEGTEVARRPSRPEQGRVVPEAARDAIAKALGIVDEEFAFVQALPGPELAGLVETMARADYRLVRVRPWSDQGGPAQVAAIWHRSAEASEYCFGLDQGAIEEMDRRMQGAKLLPIDLAIFLDSEGRPRYSAVWSRAGPSLSGVIEAKLVFESAEIGPGAISDPDRPFKALGFRNNSLSEGEGGWDYRSAQQCIGGDGPARAFHRCAIWYRRAQRLGNGFDWMQSQPKWLSFGAEGLQHHVEQDVTLSGPLPIAHYREDIPALGGKSQELFQAFIDGDNRKTVELAGLLMQASPPPLDRKTLVMMRAIAASRQFDASYPSGGPQDLRLLEQLGAEQIDLTAIRALWSFQAGHFPGAIWELESEVVRLGGYAEACTQAARTCLIAATSRIMSPEDRSVLIDQGMHWLRTAQARGFGDTERIARSFGDSLENDPRFAAWFAEQGLDRLFGIVTGPADPTVETRHALGDSPEEHLQACLALRRQGFAPTAIAGASWSGRSPFASIWRRQLAPIDDRVRVANEAAQASIALFHLGQSGDTLERLRHDPNPTMRSFLIKGLGELQADPSDLIGLIRKPGLDPGILQGLLLAIDGAAPDQTLARPLVPVILALFNEHPDAGVHSAAEWLLRNWKKEAELAQATRELAKVGHRPDFGWYVSPRGITFSLIRKPRPFVLGATWDDLNAPVSGQILTYPYLCRIPHDYAIATTEAPLTLYLEFLDQKTGEREASFRQKAQSAYNHELQGPVSSIDWLDAAEFCNWLNEQDRIARGERVYEEIQRDRGVQVLLPLDVSERSGYRLPTRAELEYACRGGTTTPWFFGESEALAGRYAWSIEDANSTKTGGLKLPNPLGLFDVLGNVWEWTMTPPSHPSSPLSSLSGKAIRDSLGRRVWNSEPRLVYGGSLREPARNIRSSSVINQFSRIQNVGFRIVRTWKN